MRGKYEMCDCGERMVDWVLRGTRDRTSERLGVGVTAGLGTLEAQLETQVHNSYPQVRQSVTGAMQADECSLTICSCIRYSCNNGS